MIKLNPQQIAAAEDSGVALALATIDECRTHIRENQKLMPNVPADFFIDAMVEDITIKIEQKDDITRRLMMTAFRKKISELLQ